MTDLTPAHKTTTGGAGLDNPSAPDPSAGDPSAGKVPTGNAPTGKLPGDKAPGDMPPSAADAAHDDRATADPHEKATAPDRLLPREECERLAEQMRHAVSGFVDAPGAAVEEADRVLEEAAARFTDAVTRRRRSLRRAWQATGQATGGGRGAGDDGTSAAANADTEVLRLALRDYRELTDRLLSR